MKTTSERNGGEVLLELFKLQGVDCIFCSPLSVWAPLWEALAKQEAVDQVHTPDYFNCRHETLAVGLASGYYKATGRPQAVLLPTALGVLNGAMAIRGAFQDRTPMIILAPDSMSFGEISGLEPGAEWPSLLGELGGPVRAAASFVKWAKDIKTSRDLVSDFLRACYFSESTPRGPVLLGIPFEVLMNSFPFTLPSRIQAHPLLAPPENIQAVADILTNSVNPVLIADHAGRNPRDAEALAGIAEILGAPVFEFWLPMYRGVPPQHPLRGQGLVEDVLPEADCVLVAGCDAPWYPPPLNFREGCKVVVLEEDPLRPRAPYWGYKTDYCLAGDIPGNMQALLQLLRKSIAPDSPQLQQAEERTRRWKTRNENLKAQQQQNAEASHSLRPVHASRLFRTLADLLPQNAVIVDEIIAQGGFMMQYLFRIKPFDHFRGTSGGLGTGIPTALGLKLADPKKMVVCLIGDGSFGYNPVPAGLGFAQQYRVPLLVIICNNQGFVSQRWNLQKYFPQGWAVKTGRFYGDTIDPTPDYSQIARAFGGFGERVDDPGALESALRRGLEAVRQGQIAIVDVLVQP